jgi:hypothetical protein
VAVARLRAGPGRKRIVVVAALLAAPIAAAEIHTQRLALTHLVARVPVPIPWTDIWHTAALCALAGVSVALLAAWHATATATAAARSRRSPPGE